jgi:uncharacterized protein YabE (DUF348 family)
MSWRKSIVPAAIALSIAGGCAHVAGGPHVSGARTVGSFSSLRLEGAADIVWRRGPTVSVTVEGPKEAVSATTTEIQGDTLVVAQKPNVSIRGKLEVKIEAPEAKSFELSGAGNLDASGLECDALSVKLRGAGNATLSGKAKSVDLAVSGAGSLKARDLIAGSAKVAVSGVGNVQVTASDELVASVSGVGGVTYFGHPKHVTRATSGIGSISAGD